MVELNELLCELEKAANKNFMRRQCVSTLLLAAVPIFESPEAGEAESEACITKLVEYFEREFAKCGSTLESKREFSRAILSTALAIAEGRQDWRAL